MPDSAAYPSLVMVIRHGEKPGASGDDKGGGPHLSIRGSARAAALPALFVPGDKPPAGRAQLCCAMSPGPSGQAVGTYTFGTVAATSSRFPTPHYLFATASSDASSRPLETVTPLAQALQCLNDPAIDTQIDPSFTNDSEDIQKLVKTVLNTPAKYAGKVVLICWHHGKIPKLLRDFGVPRHELKSWDPFPSETFDVVMKITWSGTTATMATDYQELLFGDTKV